MAFQDTQGHLSNNEIHWILNYSEYLATTVFTLILTGSFYSVDKRAVKLPHGQWTIKKT